MPLVDILLIYLMGPVIMVSMEAPLAGVDIVAVQHQQSQLWIW